MCSTSGRARATRFQFSPRHASPMINRPRPRTVSKRRADGGCGGDDCATLRNGATAATADAAAGRRSPSGDDYDIGFVPVARPRCVLLRVDIKCHCPPRPPDCDVGNGNERNLFFFFGNVTIALDINTVVSFISPADVTNLTGRNGYSSALALMIPVLILCSSWSYLIIYFFSSSFRTIFFSCPSTEHDLCCDDQLVSQLSSNQATVASLSISAHHVHSIK